MGSNHGLLMILLDTSDHDDVLGSKTSFFDFGKATLFPSSSATPLSAYPAGGKTTESWVRAELFPSCFDRFIFLDSES